MRSNWSERDIPRQGGKRAIVTGATSGIGLHTALELARAGAEVTLAVRDTGKGAQVRADLVAQASEARIVVEELDVSSLHSVRAFAERRLADGRPVDILINNAGVMGLPTRELTADGFERQIATNHLGHFALTGRLLPLLEAAPAPRVVTVSSSVTMYGRIDLDNLQGEKRYVPMAIYGQSKLANLLFMRELDRRGEGLISVAAHPGATRTNLQVHEYKHIIKIIGQSPARGALPSLYAAVGDDVRGGMYFGPKFVGMGPPSTAWLPPKARDAALAARLWALSEELTGVRYAFAKASAQRAG